jgi:hypothetical protein
MRPVYVVIGPSSATQMPSLHDKLIQLSGVEIGYQIIALNGYPVRGQKTEVAKTPGMRALTPRQALGRRPRERRCARLGAASLRAVCVFEIVERN